MAGVIFGNHSSVLVPRQDRERIRKFYCGVLGGQLTKSDQERDFVRLGKDFFIAFLYGDVADASEFLLPGSGRSMPPVSRNRRGPILL